MDKILTIFTVFIYLILRIKAEQKQCYAEIASPYSSFGGMTSYFPTRGSQMNVPQGKMADCSLIYVWGLFRHGTRYPTKKSFIKKFTTFLPKLRDEIILNHEKGRANLCEKDLENLKKWKTILSPDLVAKLAPQGVKELAFLAKKVKEAFPELFKVQSKNLFTFQCSNTNRTRDSALAFTNELLGTNFATIDGNNITQEDVFLRLFANCPNYHKSISDPSLLKEMNFFITSAMWQRITAEISLRLGFLQPLSHENITLIYNFCAYENAWQIDSKPPFCAVFTSEDLKTLEYLYDLRMYHTIGYGNADFAKNMGCSIIRDMIRELSNAANSTENVHRKGKFLFSHSEAIVPATVKLGLYKEAEELKLENYEKLIDKRKWKTALFETYASNIIAALYRCPDKTSKSRNVVIIYQNERPVMVPQCSQDPCTMEELQDIFQDVFDEKQCNLDFCKVSSSSKASLGAPFYASSNIMMIYLLLVKVLLHIK